jgi:Ni/Co efflux regulator RcnB
MRKLVLFSLAAAAAALPLSAIAQPMTQGGGHGRGHMPRPGHSWNAPGGQHNVIRHRNGGQRIVVRNRDGGQRIVVRQRGNGNQRIVVRQRDGGQRIVVRNRGGGQFHGRRFPHVTRIIQGHRVPNFWFGPQFHVQNWQVYGFGQPMHDRRWIRYYDDALLIDRHGMVHDGRYGVDWDRYEDAWGYDDRGIPAYVGEHEYRGDDEDEAYSDEESAGWDTSEYAESESHHEEMRGGHAGGGHGGGYGGGHGGGHGGPGHPPVMMPHPGAGAGAYGYGAATITETITETFVEAPQTGYIEEVVEEVVQTRRPRRVRRAPRPRCDCAPVRRHRPAAPPPAGERG